MTTAQKALNVIFVLGLVVVGVMALAGLSREDTLGGSSFLERFPIHFAGGLKVGDSVNNPTITKELVGICNAVTSQLPLEATSTDDFTCPVTGAASGDVVQVFLPSNSGSPLGGFTIGHTVASTDTITFGIVNLTGAATSSFPLATTSVQYRVTDYQ